MALSNDLITQFVKLTRNAEKPKKETVVYGTVVKQQSSDYVKFDGSDLLTPVSSTAVVNNGERVAVLIKNHTAMVTGNVSSPAARTGDVEKIGDKISDFEIVIADKISAKEFDAEKGRIDELTANNVLIREKLSGNEAEFKKINADNITIHEKLTGHEAEFVEIRTKKLDADIAELKYASINSLDVTNQRVHNLQGDYGTFKDLSTEEFRSNSATIQKLQTDKLDTTAADIKYANIEFSNIGKAAMEYLYASSGLIKDAVIDNGHITGELVGVSIKGDIIEGGTVKADKLVIKGTDGLYYKLNVDALGASAENVPEDGLHGSAIVAKTITAEKINVSDLVAFGATIGGFNITDKSIYSGVKESVHNTTRGIYMDTQGELAFGDGSNGIKYYKDTDGKYKLSISAAKMIFSSSNKSVEEVIDETVTEGTKSNVIATIEQYYVSTSPAKLSGGNWSTTSPPWTAGSYIWQRTVTMHKDGTANFSEPVCVTGADGLRGEKGDTGVQGPKGADSVQRYTWIKYATTPTTGISDDPLDRPYIGLAYNKTTATESSVYGDYTWSLIKGETGGTGVQGAKGVDGKQYYTWLKYADSPTMGMSDDPANKSYIGLAYNKITGIESTVYGDYMWSLIKGTSGAQGIQGIQGTQGVKGANGTNGQSSYFHIKYSAVEAPTSAQMTETPANFIGTYVDAISVDSSDPLKYTWSRFIGAQGANGANGIAGKNGTDGKTSYLHIKYSNLAKPTTAAHINDIGGMYIGQYTDFTLADSTNPALYTWSLIKGETGNGIKSTTIDYALSTDKVNAPTGIWNVKSPLWESGKYRWTRTTIIYSDARTYTTYSCDSSWEAINDIQIGGRNLATTSNDFKPGSGTSGIAFVKNEDGSLTVTAPPSGGDFGDYFQGDIEKIESSFKESEAFTLSYTMKSTGTIEKPKLFIKTESGYCPASGTMGEEYSTIFYVGKWIKSDDNNIQFRIWMPGNCSITMRDMKLEKGNKATDWTPAPEDIDQGLDEVYNSVKICESNIAQTAAAIRLEVSADYVSGQDFNEYKETALTITDDEIEFKFTSLADKITEVQNGIDENQQLSKEYIRFADGSIELGQEDNDFMAKLSDTELAFLEGNEKIAYISNSRLHITNAEVTNGLHIGKFQWLPRKNGNLSLMHTGENKEG